MQLTTSPVEHVYLRHGIPFPRKHHYRLIVITGPLGSGKTTLVENIHGWTGEAYIDLSKSTWWRNPLFAFRPREVHFGIPFEGIQKVTVDQWPNALIDKSRIALPPRKNYFFQIDWRRKFALDFQLPSAESIHAFRTERAKLGTHRLDAHLDKEQIRHELDAYQQLAQYFHDSGMKVCVRRETQQTPEFID